MEQAAAGVLPADFGFEWTGITYQELKAGSVAAIVFALALVFVFFFLAAQYESWSMPFMVILAVPLALMGAVAALWLRGMHVDVYTQVGFVMLIGLSAKNAILIVEFAKALHEEQGKPLLEAAVEAARLRLRPIIMTSLAFMLGVLPLAISNGAGSGSQHSIGTGVIGGMITATFLAVFFVPMFFVVICNLFSKKTPDESKNHAHIHGEQP
jgi:multidrug efflux pump subunit AcrB